MQLLVIQFTVKMFHTGFMQVVIIFVEISMFKIFIILKLPALYNNGLKWLYIQSVMAVVAVYTVCYGCCGCTYSLLWPLWLYVQSVMAVVAVHTVCYGCCGCI